MALATPTGDPPLVSSPGIAVVSTHYRHTCSSFLFAGDLNGHHQEWFGSTTTNHLGVASVDFTTVPCCDQLVVSPTHACGGTRDLLMTDVPDLVHIAVVAPIGNADHSSLLAVISMAQAVPNLCVSRKVFLKHRINWNIVCDAILDLPWQHLTNQQGTSVPACWMLCTNQGHPYV